MAEAKNHREMTRSETALLDEPRNGDKPRSEFIREDIEHTRAALDTKLEALQSKVREVGTKAKQTFDIRHHVAQHPWAMLGASLATGMVVGAVVGGHEEEEEQMMPSWHSQPDPQHQSFHAPMSHPAPRHRSARSELFQTLKLAAGAAVTDFVRQQLNKHMPAIGEQLDKVWKERGLTSTSAASAFFAPSNTGDGNNT